MLNPGGTVTLKHEITPKNAKNNNPLHTKYKLSWWLFTFSLPGRRFAPLSTRHLRHCEIRKKHPTEN